MKRKQVWLLMQGLAQSVIGFLKHSIRSEENTQKNNKYLMVLKSYFETLAPRTQSVDIS